MAKTDLKRGVFITFEGIEGCGKSTHAESVYGWLKKLSYDVVRTREPGGTKLGDRVRDLVLHSDGIGISDMAELFLFEAARSQIVGEIIRPNLDKNRIVLCDRFSDATYSYQGYAGGIGLGLAMSLDKAATGGLRPDLTILLDIDVLTGLKRAKSKGLDRMEKKRIAYHRRVRAGYLKLAKLYPRRIKVIMVRENIMDTQDAIRREVLRVIQRYKRT